MVDLKSNFDQCKDWLDRYKGFDSSADPRHEGIFKLLQEGANIGFKIKEYKLLKDFCAVLQKSMTNEMRTMVT
jgi:hypothetical protein